MKLIISSTILEAIQNDALGANPLEVCGLLLGKNWSVTQAIHTGNVSEYPEREFEINPSELIAAERNARSGGQSIIGYYHSHPTGKVEPSQIDANHAAADGRIWLIVNGKEAAAWRTSPNGKIFGRFDPVSLDCRPISRQTATS